MAPQARAKLPPELGGLTRKDMETVIYQANLGRENAQIAQLAPDNAAATIMVTPKTGPNDDDTKTLVTREARGWDGVLNRDGDAVPFSGDALQRFLRIPGMTNMVWVAYASHAGVQAKNSERSSV